MPTDTRATEPDPRLQDAIAHCAAAFLMGLDLRGIPQARRVSGRAGFASFIEADTLALQLPAGELAPGDLREGRVVLLLIEPEQHRHVLVHGSWLEFAANAVSPKVLRALGLVPAGPRAKRERADRCIGVLDIDALRWGTMTTDHDDVAP